MLDFYQGISEIAEKYPIYADEKDEKKKEKERKSEDSEFRHPLDHFNNTIWLCPHSLFLDSGQEGATMENAKRGPKPFVFVLMPFNDNFKDIYESGNPNRLRICWSLR